MLQSNSFYIPPDTIAANPNTRKKKRRRRKARQDAILKRGLLVTPDFIKNQMDKLEGRQVLFKRFYKNKEKVQWKKELNENERWRPVTIESPGWDIIDGAGNVVPAKWSDSTDPHAFSISEAGITPGYRLLSVVELKDDSPVRLMILSPEIATQAAAAAQKHNVFENLNLRRRALAAMPRGVFGEERKQMENTTLLEPRHMEIPIHHLLKKKNIQDTSKDGRTTVGSSGKRHGGRKTRRKRKRRRKRRKKTRRKRKYKPKRKNTSRKNKEI